VSFDKKTTRIRLGTVSSALTMAERDLLKVIEQGTGIWPHTVEANAVAVSIAEALVKLQHVLKALDDPKCSSSKQAT